MKTLIKLDLLVYMIVSLATFISGIVMVTADYEASSGSKNINLTFTYLGGFVLFLGIVFCILTYIKIKDTSFKE